jgi:hypothetical protein
MPDLPFTHNPLRTRADGQRLLRDLVAPLVPHFSAGRAEVRLGANRAHYGDPAGWLEGYARPLWGLAALAAGDSDFDHWPLWQQGLVSGADPAHPEYWGRPGDYDQRSVEQGSFGFALALAPHVLWQPLSRAARDRLSAWLQTINQVKLVPSNWLFFRVLVNLGLRRCGETWSKECLEADLAQIDRFYLGDGWYADGAGGPPYRDGRTGDYYVPMAFHFYGLLYARLASAEDPARAARFVERARRFAEDFQHWFAADGSALPFGRSLTYRFAQGAFWGALAFATVEALPWGVIKGIYLRHLRWWMRQPIFSETGLLTIGYAYPNLVMAESYNSSGSPYWALKAFLPLALPETHPFWSTEEAPLPPRRRVHTVAGAKLVLVAGPRLLEVTAINPGQPVSDWPRHAAHKYSKFAYSTRLGFGVPTGVATPEEGGFDSVLSLSDDGRFFRVREHCVDSQVRDGVAFSRWEPWPGVELWSWLLAEPIGHLRIHRLRTARKLWSIEGGFAVPYTDKTLRLLLPAGPPGPIVRTPDGASALRNLCGERQPACTDVGANGGLLASLSAMPFLRASHEPGEHWLACYAGASLEGGSVFADAVDFSVAIEGGEAKVRQRDELWWSSIGGPCGASSPARHLSLAPLISPLH